MGQDTSLDVAVKICAIVGTILGAFGSVLGLFNFVKARKKEKIEAKQNLVRAEYRKYRDRMQQIVRDLYVINGDARPITAMRADFFHDSNEETPAFSKPLDSLGPNSGVCLDHVGLKGPIYKLVKFRYKDASGHQHEYVQDDISLFQGLQP